MFTRLRKWLAGTTAAPAPVEPPAPSRGMFTTHDGPRAAQLQLGGLVDALKRAEPAMPAGIAMDDARSTLKTYNGLANTALPEALLGWFAGQRFIGYQTCAMVAQQWLVDKACTMPARDAIRHGFEIQVEDPAVADELREQDKYFRLAWNMEQFVKMGRVFGVRLAFFSVESTDPYYYEKPFNPDGITPGSYRGIVQVDPYWCTPILDLSASSDPTSVHFYDPMWWTIGGRKFHRSHLCIFRNSEVADMFKPMYNYGGISVPQKIMERVYAAERTANEGPQLAMTKRTLVWNTDVGALLANQEKFAEHMVNWIEYRDNYGVKINDAEDTMAQYDTALGDLDSTIMTQYQLVAAAANVPAVKLLGTTPKGFNSTGEYEESSYHEELETIQSNDLTPLVERHHMMVTRSIIEPQRNLAPGSIRVQIDWAPVDSPTAKEYAEINKSKADTDVALVGIGAIDGMDVRARLQADPNSTYTSLADIEEDTPEDIVREIMSNGETQNPGETVPGP